MGGLAFAPTILSVNRQTGRRDHYLPQGYLRGFIDPAREKEPQPLWKLDIASARWAERSTKQVGHIEGFYDYSGMGPEVDSLPSADDTFLKLENEFPIARERLLSLAKKDFRNWKKHLPFLLRYMNMLRARSPLYFAQKEAEGRSLPTSTVQSVDGNKITLTSMEPSPPPATFIKNRTITHMREEIQNSDAWFWDLNWALRYCETVAEPFVTSETPFLAEMLAGVPEVQAFQHPETLLYFPVCWKVCLFGSRQRFDLGTGKLASHDMEVVRRKYRIYAQDFVISPTKLDDITSFGETQVPVNAAAGSPSPLGRAVENG